MSRIHNTSGGRGSGSRGLGTSDIVPLEQTTTSNTKERKTRRRGRGRGQGVQAVVPEDIHQNINVEWQKTKRKLVALPAEIRQDRVSQKREAELEWVLLPDATPRKRKTKTLSPEHQPCVMVDSVTLLSAESAEHSTSNVSHSVGVNDIPFEAAYKGWLQQTDMCYSDDDDDLNIDDDTSVLSTALDRNAAAETACVNDLTTFQTALLQTEDETNDRAIRDILPDDCHTFNWSNDRTTFEGRREIFTEITGPTFDVTDQTRPIEVFDKMFDVEFIDYLCTKTNRYAARKKALLREQNKLSPHSRLTHWTPTDRDEMVSFLTIQILQGLYPMPEEEAYFTFNGFGTMPYFSKIMSYNRFLLLKIMLYFVDSETSTDKTRLCKIRPVIDYFNEKFSRLYMPSQELAIDESLLKWHGRLSFTQKIKSKAAQVGIKTYELCESSSGYLWKFFVYAGKDKPRADTDDSDGGITQPNEDETIVRHSEDEATDRSDDDSPDEANNRHEYDVMTDRPDRLTTGNCDDCRNTATTKIVFDLIEPLLHRGHTLIMDNFYNSPLLLRFLKKKKTDCYGTLRLNREFVPESVKTLTKTDLRHGEVVATYCPDLSVMVWRDANIVSMISTYHNLQIGSKDKIKYNRLACKPTIVLDYNKNMAGVDRKDQFLSAQPMERLRNRVWYKKLFRRLYNAALFNCFVIYSRANRKINHRKFRTVLADELLKRHRQIDLTNEPRLLNVRKLSGQVLTTTTTTTNRRYKKQIRPIIDHNHFPVRTGSKYTVCTVCPKKSRTIWKCEECDVNLCIEFCFKAYHKP